MKDKNRLVLALTLILVIGFIAIYGYKSGINISGIGNNPAKRYSSIEELKANTSFDFLVPNIIKENDITSIGNIMGNMVEINTPSINFRAAPFIAYNVEPSGDYSKPNIDNRYINSDETLYVRYRVIHTNESDSDSSNIKSSSSDINLEKTLVTLKINDIAYSISLNYYISENEITHNLGINLDEMNKVSLDDLLKANDGSQSKVEDKENTDSSNKDINYKLYESTDKKISFIMPDIESKLIEVSNNDDLAFMINNQILFIITKNSNIDENTEGSKAKSIELSNGYKLIYNLKEIAEDDSGYKDSLLVIDNIDTIANTFKLLEK